MSFKPQTSLTLFLYLSCTISLVTAANNIEATPTSNSKSDLDPSVDSFPLFEALFSILYSQSFYGEWETPNPSTQLKFDNNKGFVQLDFPTSSDEDPSKELFFVYFFDGFYIDKKFIRFALSDYHMTSTSNIVNATLSYMKYYGLIIRSEAKPMQCDLNITIFFLDLSNGQPLFIPSPPDRSNIGLQIMMSSHFCKFELTTSVLTAVDPVVESQIIPYIAIQSIFICLEGLAYLVLYKALRTKPMLVLDLSLGTLCFFTAHDVYQFLNHIYASASLGSRDIKPMIQGIGIGYAIIVIFYNLPLLLEVRTRTVELQWKDISEKILNVSKVGSIITIFQYLLTLIVLIFNFTAFILSFEAISIHMREFFYFLFALFLLPQIAQAFVLGKKFKWNFFYLGALVIPKVSYLIYVEWYSLNIFRYTPHIPVCYLLLGIISIQFLILVLQIRWPTIWVKPPQVYKISRIQQDNRENCPICLEDFYKEDTKNNLEAPLLGNNVSSDYLVTTPCHHEFHLSCLKSWLDYKFECPYCRQPLPLSYQLSDIRSPDPGLVL